MFSAIYYTKADSRVGTKPILNYKFVQIWKMRLEITTNYTIWYLGQTKMY